MKQISIPGKKKEKLLSKWFFTIAFVFLLLVLVIAVIGDNGISLTSLVVMTFVLFVLAMIIKIVEDEHKKPNETHYLIVHEEGSEDTKKKKPQKQNKV